MKKIETKVLFRPHLMGQIMTNPQGKTNAQKYADAVEALEKTIKDLAATGEKAIKTREKLEAKADKLTKEIEELAKVKDEVLLSKTCRNALKTMAIEIRYKRRKRLENKYVKKGLLNEDDSTELYSEWKGEFLEQNKTRRQNEFFTGETDLEFLDEAGEIEKVTDVKTCYDIDTFEDNRDEEAKKDHYYQLLGYCDLTGAKTSSVAYCLTNSDFTIINDEIRRETFKLKADELEGFDVPLKRVLEITKDHIFDYETYINFLSNSPVQYLTTEELEELIRGEHPDEEAQEMFNSFEEVELSERVIEVEVERDEEEIGRMKERVRDCRKYLATKYNIFHIEG